MPIINLADFSKQNSVPKGSVFVLGFFDGVHLGHRALITEAVRIAAELGGRSTCVWTFNTLPRAKNKSLTTIEEKCRIFAECGVNYVILEDFDSLKSVGGDDFFNHLITDKYSPDAVVCGFNFAFGKGAQYSAADLSRMAKEKGILCSVVGEQIYGGQTVSASRIRKLIEEGKMEEANVLLASPYSLTSPIEHGVQIGRKMGVRTINQRLPVGKIAPKNGVYCCSVIIRENGKDSTYGGVCNIGSRPTVNSDTNDITVETHLFDFDGEIYGETVTTKLHAMIREERKFDSIDSLKAAIENDAARSREILKNIL